MIIEYKIQILTNLSINLTLYLIQFIGENMSDDELKEMILEAN